ncbi:MAG: glycine cleavage system aminomethyltransferase GcvT [Porticoccaceae bacterium]|jgi:aminomethyltransferase|nr:glycine cleavage system aminomethyltransferase GcvT [Porticoccaceae bacterium]MBT5577359.1 glycine cleavage system aminomethyltransferase GcvT [Porticoccaceae bacterium]
MPEDTALKHTSFYDYHLAAGGKMVPFAGYSMAVQYSDGIMQEHLHCRDNVGLFDVSHMGQVVVRGEGAAAALERLMPVDLEALVLHQQTYATFTTESGGISDDLIVTRWADDEFFFVVNAACKEQDIAHLQQHLPALEIDYLADRQLLALQGRRASEVMAELAPEANKLRFMNGGPFSIDGIDCYVTRSGYTGEDGFEISMAAADAKSLADRLLAFETVRWVGLGARDSLRLEAGLCLYGHDLDLDTSPVEASISWSISKSRRSGGAKEGGFLGAEKILSQLIQGADKKRVGFLIEGRAPVREGAEIIDASGAVVGRITSGGFGPTLGAPIAMGYVPSDLASPGTKLNALVRGKPRPIKVTKMPLVEQRYYRG